MRYPRVKVFACPTERKYPLNTKKRAANAHARWHQEGTTHCEGGHERIIKAERRFGIKPRRE